MLLPFSHLRAAITCVPGGAVEAHRMVSLTDVHFSLTLCNLAERLRGYLPVRLMRPCEIRWCRPVTVARLFSTPPPQCPFSRVSSFLLLCHYYDSIPSQTEKELNEISLLCCNIMEFLHFRAVASLLLLLRLTWQSSIICSYHVIWYILRST